MGRQEEGRGEEGEVTDVQILTLAIAVVVPLSLLIYSNSRVTDAKEVLRAEIKTLQTELSAKLTAIDAFLHEAVMGKLEDVDRRLADLERKQ
jgi:hypothetical protein